MFTFLCNNVFPLLLDNAVLLLVMGFMVESTIENSSSKRVEICAIIIEQWLQNTAAKYILVQKALSCVACSANALNANILRTFLKICKYSTDYRNDENIRYSKAISVKTAAWYQIKGFVIPDDKWN